MIKDRGMMKWQGMMLTEHTNLLDEWKRNNELVTCPKLEEWELTLIAEEIERAYQSQAPIKLNYWRNGVVKSDVGIPIIVDQEASIIVLEDSFGTTRYPFVEIIGVSVLV